MVLSRREEVDVAVNDEVPIDEYEWVDGWITRWIVCRGRALMRRPAEPTPPPGSIVGTCFSGDVVSLHHEADGHAFSLPLGLSSLQSKQSKSRTRPGRHPGSDFLLSIVLACGLGCIII